MNVTWQKNTSLFICPCVLDEWDPRNQEASDSDRLTGLEDFGMLLRPLGLSEKKLIPDPIPFTEPDPLGANLTGDKSLQYRGNSSDQKYRFKKRLDHFDCKCMYKKMLKCQSCNTEFR